MRALARATKLMQDDTAVARDAFFAQMAAKAFGAKTDPKLAELQWSNMRPYFATAMPITDAGMAGAQVLPHPGFAQRHDADRQFLRAARPREMIRDPRRCSGRR